MANSVAETCSYKYSKTPVKIVLVVLTLYTCIIHIYDYYSTTEMVCANVKTYSFSAFVKKFDRNYKRNTSAMFNKIHHYKILQKAVQQFVVVMCVRAERIISTGATQDANDSRPVFLNLCETAAR
jgi:hypothetical protein